MSKGKDPNGLVTCANTPDCTTKFKKDRGYGKIGGKEMCCRSCYEAVDKKYPRYAPPAEAAHATPG